MTDRPTATDGKQRSSGKSRLQQQQQQQPQPQPKVPPIEDERGPQAPVREPEPKSVPERAGSANLR